MRRASRVLIGLLAGPMLCMGAAPARAAGDDAGTAAASFLSVGAGASMQSMAGAGLASGHDLAAASWNVASLARVDALQFSFAHAPLAGGASQEWLAAGGRAFGATRWGLETLFHREPDLDGRDASHTPTGSRAVSDMAVGARLAQPLGRFVTAGFGAHFVHESLAGTTGSGLSFDAGLRADAGPLGFALAARHLGGAMDYAGARFDLPAVIAGGLSWTDFVRGIRVNADFESPRHYFNSVRVGGEWLWRGRVALRTGYRATLGAPAEAATSGPTFGVGTGVGTLWLDYSYVLDGGDESGEHRVGITFHPGVPGMGGSERREETRVQPAPRPRIEPVRQPVERVAPPPAKPAEVKPQAPAPKPVETPPPAPVVATPPVPAVTSVPSAPAPRPVVVVVAAGETMAMIAKRWDTSVAALMMTNDLVSDRVLLGQKLKLPPAVKKK